MYTDEEIDRAFECLLGMPARQADVGAIRFFGSATPRGVAEYVWDHWMGEPEETSVEQLEQCLLDNDWIILDDGTEITHDPDQNEYTLWAQIVPSATQEGAWNVHLAEPRAVATSTSLDELLAQVRQWAKRKRAEGTSDRPPNQQP